MKSQIFTILSNGKSLDIALYNTRRIFKFGMAATQTVLIGLGIAIASGQAVNSRVDDQNAQVLTCGPVHEAFAGIVNYNPEPGVIVHKAPPKMIEESPPEIRPAGENINWIPGYWGWDDERSDYLWISGTWRALPPGRQWTTGYWGPAGQGHQWVSGYWANSSVQEVTYLPRPPQTVEVGPNVAAPSSDHGWTPGSWMWQQERYAWRPGYWAQGRSNWDWIPANYVWTPRGYVFVDGYWDYSFHRRGVLYAPIHFQPGYYSQHGYSYSPSVAIELVALMEHLFLRPNYHHYYFGDYYDRRYRNSGYYSPYAYQISRYGYDPVYSSRRWTHRQDQDWERRYEASYDYRRDHESARPPRTWADQKKLRLDTAESKEQQLLMATPFDQMAKQKDKPIRIERVAAKEREKITAINREIRKTREQRKTIESEAENITNGKNERDIKPSKIKLPTSPIVGKSPDRFDRKQAPPKPQRSSVVDPEKQTSERKPNAEKSLHKAQGKESKGEPQQEPKANEPTQESRQEPQAKEPKREPRQQPKANEPKHQASSSRKLEPDKKDYEQPGAKAKKKEDK